MIRTKTSIQGASSRRTGERRVRDAPQFSPSNPASLHLAFHHHLAGFLQLLLVTGELRQIH